MTNDTHLPFACNCYAAALHIAFAVARHADLRVPSSLQADILHGAACLPFAHEHWLIFQWLGHLQRKPIDATLATFSEPQTVTREVKVKPFAIV